MKRRKTLERKRAKRRQQREAMKHKSLGKSRYADKVKSGQQMYGPAPTKEEVNRLVRYECRVRGD